MPRGRTRTFDPDQALEQAVDLFARQGYEGTSIAQLTRAMGLTPPQLYLAYGSKRELFDQVIERYGEHRRPYLDDVLSQPTAQRVARRWLEGAVEHDTRPDHPRGCLTVQCLLASSPEDRGAAETLADVRNANQAALQRRLEQAVSDGDLPADSDTAGMARYLSTVSQGISVQASGGASKESLLAIVEYALEGIPDLTSA